HGREVLERIVIERWKQEAVHRERHRGDQHRIAVGIGPHDRLGADIGGAAAAVLDHHLLAPDVRELAGNHPGDGVGPAAGRKRHDQAHETVRPILGGRGRSLGGYSAGWSRGQGRRGGEPNRPAAADHSLTLMLAALIPGSHFSISARRCAPSSSGVEPTMTTPSWSSLALIGDSRSTATVSACILRMMSSGVLAGTKKANHDDVS